MTHIKRCLSMKETEFCLNSRTIKLPLTIESVLTSTHFDLVIGKDENGLSIYRELSKEEKEWIFFLQDKVRVVMDEAEDQREKFLMEVKAVNGYPELLYFDIQTACAMLLLTRCGYLLERDMNIKRKNKNIYKDKIEYESDIVQQELNGYQDQIVNLEKQLQEVNNRIMESEKKINPGCEAASEKRLQQWKDVYFPAIHAVARKCEEEGPKEGSERRQRKDIRAMLEAQLKDIPIPNTVVDYTFQLLDDELVDRRGGNT